MASYVDKKSWPQDPTVPVLMRGEKEDFQINDQTSVFNFSMDVFSSHFGELCVSGRPYFFENLSCQLSCLDGLWLANMYRWLLLV